MQDFVGQLYGWFTFGCSSSKGTNPCGWISQNAPSSTASPWHWHPKTRDQRKYDHYHQDLRKLARLQPVIFQRVFFHLEQHEVCYAKNFSSRSVELQSRTFEKAEGGIPAANRWYQWLTWLETRSVVRFVEMKVDMLQLFQCLWTLVAQQTSIICVPGNRRLDSASARRWVKETLVAADFILDQ